MANNTYDAGPQLPNYMKKRPAANTAATSSPQKTSAKEGAARKQPSGSATRSASAATRSNAAAKRTGGAQAKVQAQRISSSAQTKKRAASAQKPRSTSTGTNGNKRKAKPKQSKRTLQVMVAAVCGLAVIIGVVWLLTRESTATIPTDITGIMNTKKTFKDGVKLIGVDVSGMTPEEATGLVKYAAEKKLGKVALTVALDDASWTFSANDLGMNYDLTEMFANGLAFGRSEDATVVDVTAAGAGEFDATYTWDREAILRALMQLESSVNKDATQPYAQAITDWESTERFNYIAGEEGVVLNADATADLIEQALSNGEFETTITPMINAVLPTMTLDEVKAHTQLIASYTTNFSVPRGDEIKENRLFNIQKAADIINGNVIQPGEQWSFNTIVGPRTHKLGWKDANGISGGKEYTLQAGGGICQPSTTLYNALLCANIKIVDRRAHTIPSDYVAVGLDATVNTGSIDFVFENDTQYPLHIFAQVKRVEGSSSRRTITVYVYGEPLPAGVEYKSRSNIIEVIPRDLETVYTDDPTIPTGYQKEKNQQREGYVAEAYQDKYADGKLVESKLLYTDRYYGNPAEILIGTGPALLPGEAVPEGLVPVGTPPTPASSRA